jgi:hypothetical protein
MVDIAKIVTLHGKRVWVEKDFMGTVHIKMQHDISEEAFDFIQIQYDYAYTDNASQAALTRGILKLLGIEDNPGPSK